VLLLEEAACRQETAAIAERTAATGAERLSFRAFLESPDFCDLALSPLVAAIADASDGVRPTTIGEAECQQYFGCSLDELPPLARRYVAVQAGGRGGKTSRLLAPKALHAAWTADLPTLRPGEHAVALLVSSELDLARQALAFCRGYVEASPVLSAALVGKPKTNSLTLRRPDGKLVDVRVRAAGARGKGGRAFTLVFAGLDEACFFYDATGVVNDQEIYRAVAQRVVPDGQVWLVSTPWLAGVGLLEEKLARDWGEHAQTLCVRGVGTRALNPTWDPDGTIEAALREDDPDNAEREIDAVPMAAGSQMFFALEAITAAVNEKRPQRLERDPAALYGAGGDCAFKRNSSALAVVALRDARYKLAALEELKPTPGLPLKPSAVVDHFAPVLKDYGVTALTVDAYERADVALELARHQLSAAHDPEKVESYIFARKALHEGRVELPKHPRFARQLRDVVSKPQPGGGLSITSPKKADGSHGDLVSAWVLAVWTAGHAQPVRVADPDPIPVPPRFAY
jgi:hypothetical protein